MLEDIKGLIWTLAGTALVLITLSGKTQAMGLWISGIALVSTIIAMLFSNADKE
jgi:hypothetical protein